MSVDKATEPSAASEVLGDAVCFSGCGFNVGFELGALRALEKSGRAARVRAWGGASIGAAVAAAAACDIGARSMLDMFCALLKRWRAEWLPCLTHSQASELIAEIDRLLPADAAARCNNRLFVAIADISKRSWRVRFLRQFVDKRDLVECLRAAVCIPPFTGWTPQAVRSRRGRLFVDAGLVDSLPVPRALRGCCLCISASSDPAISRRAHIALDPDGVQRWATLLRPSRRTARRHYRLGLAAAKSPQPSASRLELETI